MLRATADGLELYLAVGVSGDEEELRRLITGRNKFGGGTCYLTYLGQQFASR